MNQDDGGTKTFFFDVQDGRTGISRLVPAESETWTPVHHGAESSRESTRDVRHERAGPSRLVHEVAQKLPHLHHHGVTRSQALEYFAHVARYVSERGGQATMFGSAGVVPILATDYFPPEEPGTQGKKLRSVKQFSFFHAIPDMDEQEAYDETMLLKEAVDNAYGILKWEGMRDKGEFYQQPKDEQTREELEQKHRDFSK